jgi:hypothetical protein
LISDAGGSGTFYDLAVVVDRDGEPVNVATTFLGDRLIINGLNLDGDEIVVDMITSGPNDPLCCPSQQVIKRYKLEPTLVEQTAGADYSGTYQASLPAASSPGLNITLTLNPDNSAEMISDYLNGQPALIEWGDWNASNGSLTVTFTSINGRPQHNQIIFERQDGALVARQYDPMLYGDTGLTLNKQ